jgi:hypothetical protein
MENVNEGKANVGQSIDRKENLKLIGDILLTNKSKAGAGKGNTKSTMNNNASLKAKVKNSKMNIRKAQ